MNKIQRDIWIANDGEEFDTEHECKVHEALVEEKDIIERFLDTQRWNPSTNKGYADRTLTTFRSLMGRYTEFKIAIEGNKDEIHSR